MERGIALPAASPRQDDNVEAKGALAVALRRPFEPVSEDEIPGLIEAPQLAEARDILATLHDNAHWGAEYGWTLVLTRRNDRGRTVAGTGACRIPRWPLLIRPAPPGVSVLPT